MPTLTGKKLPPIGAQPIVFGKKYPLAEGDNFDRILDCLAAAGFKATEGGLADPAVTTAKLAARGMRLAGTHTTLRPLMENPDRLADYVLACGAADICNSGYLDWKHETADQVKQSCEALNVAGRKLRARGVHLHYHNHAFEFENKLADAGGRTIMDLTLELLDPSACDLCVDVAWVHRGGLDPVKFLRDHKAKVGYVHLKDFDGTNWTELGKGQVPILECLTEISLNPNVRWAMWEEDQSQIDPFDAARDSGAYLKSIGALA